ASLRPAAEAQAPSVEGVADVPGQGAGRRDGRPVGAMAGEMIYGPRTELVQEVIDLVRSGQILKAAGAPPADVTAIHDLDQAKHAAWRATYGPDELTWTDIREQKTSKVYAALRALPMSVDDALTAAVDLLAKLLRPQLRGPVALLLDDALSDLHTCAQAR